MLLRGVPYADLGADHFDHRDKQRAAKRLVRRLTDLGFNVEVTAAA
jgi:transposase